MKRNVIIILVLVFVIIGLTGAIFFIIKTDSFGGKDNDIKDKENSKIEEKIEEEVIDSPEEVIVEDVSGEFNDKSSDDKPSNDNKTNNDKINNDKTTSNDSNNKQETTPVTQPENEKPVVIDPTIPIENDTMTSLVCSIDLTDEDNIPTKQVITIDFYDSTKLPWSIIMKNYINLASFGYTDSQIKELLKEIRDSAESIPGFEFGTWQTGDTIELYYSSTAPSLREYYPDEYKIGGEMSYDVTKRELISQGYTCK